MNKNNKGEQEKMNVLKEYLNTQKSFNPFATVDMQRYGVIEAQKLPKGAKSIKDPSQVPKGWSIMKGAKGGIYAIPPAGGQGQQPQGQKQQPSSEEPKQKIIQLSGETPAINQKTGTRVMLKPGQQLEVGKNNAGDTIYRDPMRGNEYSITPFELKAKQQPSQQPSSEEPSGLLPKGLPDSFKSVNELTKSEIKNLIDNLHDEVMAGDYSDEEEDKISEYIAYLERNQDYARDEPEEINEEPEETENSKFKIGDRITIAGRAPGQDKTGTIVDRIGSKWVVDLGSGFHGLQYYSDDELTTKPQPSSEEPEGESLHETN